MIVVFFVSLLHSLWVARAEIDKNEQAKKSVNTANLQLFIMIISLLFVYVYNMFACVRNNKKRRENKKGKNQL